MMTHVELDSVRTLRIADQMTYLRTRALDAASGMEAETRYIHVGLRGGSTVGNALDTPPQLENPIAERVERGLLVEHLSNRIRPLFLTRSTVLRCCSKDE